MKSAQALSNSTVPADSFLDRYFNISARGSTLKREVIAGFTTFLAMVYSVIVVPNMLGTAGFDPADRKSVV